MPDPVRYAVVCDCEGEMDVLAWIDDSRLDAGVTFGITAHGTAYENFGMILRNSGHSFRFGHEPCRVGIALNERDLDQLVDAVAELQKHIGCSTIEVPAMTRRRGDTSATEIRTVILLNLLCRVNGKLPEIGPHHTASFPETVTEVL